MGKVNILKSYQVKDQIEYVYAYMERGRNREEERNLGCKEREREREWGEIERDCV